VLLSNISYIIKDISHLSLYRVKHKSINNKLVFNLNLLILKYRGDAIYKRIRVFKLDYNRVVESIKQWGTLLGS
jgi:hypothetical protein